MEKVTEETEVGTNQETEEADEPRKTMACLMPSQPKTGWDHVKERTANVERAASPDSPPESILQFFAYEHLKPELAEVSQPFCRLAWNLVDTLPRNPERTVALRKLLEAKDAAVRAFIAK